MQKYYIGTSGWVYQHWKNVFYPESLTQKKWLEFYSQNFKTVEVNSSFYHLPQESTFEKWYAETPDDFLFAVKGWGWVTHRKRLKVTNGDVKVFTDRARILKNKLGPILWQLPPSLKYEVNLISDFLATLPQDLKHSIEVRHPSFLNRQFYDLLAQKNIAFCLADSPKFSFAEIITADFTYIRMHGSKRLYSSKYTLSELTNWAKKISKIELAYVYFNNDSKGYAIENAEVLSELTRMK